ncbi:hypothetical protein JVX92_04200 [Microbacterium hominis]|uniref:hypothetical protein n=1 Tax=Microbacterium hominis TaxID=162426 RepID=UPI0019656547|nr:hypothetical protein [Microbacterium hominis]QRY41475.1 hypothetical protein JVX92_04200 [Microbacterium hominis]
MATARGVASTAVIVVAAVLLPLSIVSGWARTQLVDEDAFAATLAPLSQAVEVQDAVIAASTTAIDERLDTAGLTGTVIDGLIDLGMGDRAAQALRRLEGPAATALQQLVHVAVADAVRSDAFSTVWEQVVRRSHRALTVAATSDGGGVVVQTADGLGIQIGAIVAAVEERLVAQGAPLAPLIPEVDHVVIIGSGDTLSAIRTGYAVGVALGGWMPVVTAVLFIGGVVLARRRAAALARAGVAAGIGSAILLIAAGVGRLWVASSATQADFSSAAALAIYDRLLAGAVGTAVVVLVVALVLVGAGWLAGASPRAVALRRRVAHRWAHRTDEAAADEPTV